MSELRRRFEIFRKNAETLHRGYANSERFRHRIIAFSFTKEVVDEVRLGLFIYSSLE